MLPDWSCIWPFMWATKTAAVSSHVLCWFRNSSLWYIFWCRCFPTLSLFDGYPNFFDRCWGYIDRNIGLCFGLSRFAVYGHCYVIWERKILINLLNDDMTKWCLCVQIFLCTLMVLCYLTTHNRLLMGIQSVNSASALALSAKSMPK